MELVGQTFFFQWEVSLMEWLQSVLPASLISVISAFSMFGEELLIVLVLGFLYWCYDKEKAKQIGLNVLMVNVWNPMIKNVALRRRPYMDHEGIRILRVVDSSADPMNISAQGYSMPSGHSSNASSLYGSLAGAFRKKWLYIAACVVCVLVGFSRMVVGAHYPTDVMCGWLLGLITILLVSALNRCIKSRPLFYAVLLLSGLPGFFYCRSTDFFSGYGMLVGFIAGMAVEERFVRFENTRSPLRAILRVVCGAALFFAFNTLLKLPFKSEFLDSGTFAALMVRCARYAIITFIEFALYPMLFKYTARIGK